MTPQEAIERIYTILKNCEFTRADKKSLKTAISALEKQIPKKPDYEGDGYEDEGNLIYDTWICPSCSKDYEVDYDDFEHCPNCGQAIDWSELR